MSKHIVMENNNKGAVTSSSLAEVLKFYHESGVDCTLLDNLEEDTSSDLREKSFPINAPIIETATNRSKDTLYWVGEARRLAESSATLEELRGAVDSFQGCEIKKSAMNTVFSDGNPAAKIMLIGEAPGSNEDKEGRPFCGASGMLLDRMLAAIDLDRTNVYISNTVFWRPPGNRRPTDFELEVCRPFVEKHISLIKPKMLVMVGSTACYTLLKTQDSISRVRGKFYEYTNDFLEHRSIVTTVIFHPAYLLRQPMQKRLAWEDLKMLRDHMKDLQL